jgi:hypothetical protein
MSDVFRTNYRQLTPEEQTALKIIKGQAQYMLDMIDGRIPDPRCFALAKTKLEECVMWAVKGVTG